MKTKILIFSKSLALAFVALNASLNTQAAPSPSWNSGSSGPTQWSPGGTPKSNSANQESRAARRELGSTSEISNVSPFSPGSNNVAIDLGQIFLMGDLGKTYGDSLGVRLHYTYGVSEMFGFDSQVGYSEHGDGGFSMLSALAGLRMNLSWYDKVIPYVHFGLGFYRPDYTLGQKGELSIAPVVFGLHVGPGINLELTKRMFFGASLTYHDIFGTKKRLENNAEKVVDGSFASFFLTLGTTF